MIISYYIYISNGNVCIMRILLLFATLVRMSTANAEDYRIERNGTIITVNQEKEYKKVGISEVPAQLLKQVSSKYAGYTLTEAHASDDGDFKIVLVKGNNRIKAYYKATGVFIKEEA